MSEKAKFRFDEAMIVARAIASVLVYHTQKIVIAGSLRRGKPFVGDAELLYVPIFGPGVTDDFFLGPPVVDRADEALNAMLRRGELAKRTNERGSTMWGPSNKFAVHPMSGLPVDFFSTTEENWWVSLVIRTGSKETNLRLTTGAHALGRKLNAYGCGVTVIETGEVIPAHSEEEVFELCGVPYLKPEDR